MKRNSFLLLLTLNLGVPATSVGQTMTVIQTASTNRPEIRVTVEKSADRKQASVIAETDGAKHEVPYKSGQQKRLWSLVNAAAPLANLPVSHCMKSASFGTSLFVEIDGQRSSDLSCPNQPDARVAALRTELAKLLVAATAQQERIR